jgi:predicted fused transcriptional regulator/phosphomethylpyrimidine kinase/predicted transcriptional regulator
LNTMEGLDDSTHSEVKLKLPCEIVTEQLLPLMRKALVEELVIKHGVSQLQAAKIVGVTQPAVSSYLHSQPRMREEFKGSSKIEELAKNITEDWISGKLSETDAIQRVCELCTEMRSNGPICTIHHNNYKELPINCAICVEDLSKSKQRSREDLEIINSVRQAVRIIESCRELALLIPEIGMNITYAKPKATRIEDIAGIPGRIHPIGGYPRSSRPAEFSGSSHVARATLTMMALQPSLRSAISLRYDPEAIELLSEKGLIVSLFDRRDEPPEVRAAEGMTIPWGIKKAYLEKKDPPTVIYDLGGIGKEPMIFLFGINPIEVAQIAADIARSRYKRK